MKTREEILSHLLENGYTKKAIHKIVGFMVGKELKGVDEVIRIKKGELSFNDFIDWYNGTNEEECEECYCPQCVLESLIGDISEILLLDMELGKDELVERRGRQLDFLLSLLDED